jgi:hypothetical protein
MASDTSPPSLAVEVIAPSAGSSVREMSVDVSNINLALDRSSQVCTFGLVACSRRRHLSLLQKAGVIVCNSIVCVCRQAKDLLATNFPE